MKYVISGHRRNMGNNSSSIGYFHLFQIKPSNFNGVIHGIYFKIKPLKPKGISLIIVRLFLKHFQFYESKNLYSNIKIEVENEVDK